MTPKKARGSGRKSAQADVVARQAELLAKLRQIASDSNARSQSDHGRETFGAPMSYLKRETYNLVRQYQAADTVEQFGIDLNALGFKPGRTEDLEDNEFHWALLTYGRFGRKINPNERRRIAQELAKAADNDVPAHDLIGFISQCATDADIAEWKECKQLGKAKVSSAKRRQG